MHTTTRGAAPEGIVARRSSAPLPAPAERVAELVGQGALRRYPSCPVCGSTRRAPLPDSGADNRYVRAIPLVAPIAPAELPGLLEAHRCETCSAAWCDPWLSRRVAARLYTHGFGQHYGGWQIFHASVTGSSVETHDYWQEQVWSRIRAVAGPVRRYVELNCPFSGLLPRFRRDEVGAGPYRRLARGTARELRSRRPYPKGVASVVRRAFDLRKPLGWNPVADAADSDLPAERILAVEPSVSCWGGNCISRGVSCHSLAPSLLAAERLPLAEVEAEGLCCDVAVLTQLDHFFEPMAVLERFLAMSRLVVLAGHHSDHLTKQHPFAFGPRIAEYLRSRGWRAADVSDATVHPAKRGVNLCVFVSREIHL